MKLSRHKPSFAEELFMGVGVKDFQVPVGRYGHQGKHGHLATEGGPEPKKVAQKRNVLQRVLVTLFYKFETDKKESFKNEFYS